MILAAHDNTIKTLDFKKLTTVLKHKDKGDSKYDTLQKKKSNALKQNNKYASKKNADS